MIRFFPFPLGFTSEAQVLRCTDGSRHQLQPSCGESRLVAVSGANVRTHAQSQRKKVSKALHCCAPLGDDKHM